MLRRQRICPTRAGLGMADEERAAPVGGRFGTSRVGAWALRLRFADEGDALRYFVFLSDSHPALSSRDSDVDVRAGLSAGARLVLTFL